MHEKSVCQEIITIFAAQNATLQVETNLNRLGKNLEMFKKELKTLNEQSKNPHYQPLLQMKEISDVMNRQ